MPAKNSDAKVLRGIGKLNVSTHKAMDKVRDYTLREMGLSKYIGKRRKTKKPRN